MKKNAQKGICLIPLILWFTIIPLIVKLKLYANPLSDYAWYSTRESLADFFLYYKSLFVTITGIFMLGLLIWQIGKTHCRENIFDKNATIFIPIYIYLFLTILSSLLSNYRYFCVHGSPDQFETIWNLIAYVIALYYCYYLIVYHNVEQSMLKLIYVGAGLVGIVCVLQFFKIDIYRLIYAGEGYSFTFAEGTVYGPFYNTNYVGFYTLLFVPLFVLFFALYKNWKVRLISAVLTVFLLVAMFGAQSATAEIVFVAVCVFAVLFILLKNVKDRKVLWFPIITIIVACTSICVAMIPYINSYIQACDTEKTDLENIYTRDNDVEIDYKGNKLYVQMVFEESVISFDLKDQNQDVVSCDYVNSAEGYYYYQIIDSRFEGITITPTILSEDPIQYGFMVTIDEKGWYFTNQLTDDGTYYYYSDQLKPVKLTPNTSSPDFTPLVNKSNLASGRGYIWNKTIAMLKNYIFLGSGADTFTLVYPNGDFVDKYNNGYDNMILSKPHSMYLQIAVQSGVLSLLCFLVFYAWYFISSLRIYFKQHLDNSLTIMGFAIMLGTLGYMLSGLLNDSTITVAPLYWAMMGIGIGINHRISSGSKE